MAICENAPSAPGYTIINADKTVYAARSTEGVTEIMTGVYGVEIDDADMRGRYVVFDADGFTAIDDAGILAAVAERTDRLPDAPAATGDVTTAASEIIAAIPGSSIGPGGTEVTLVITDIDKNKVADAQVWITTDEEGEVVVAGARSTNDSGRVTFTLDTGVPYYRWADKAETDFTNPQPFTVEE